QLRRGARRRPGRRHRRRPEPAAAGVRPGQPRGEQAGLRDHAEREPGHRDGRPDLRQPRLRVQRDRHERGQADVLQDLRRPPLMQIPAISNGITGITGTSGVSGNLGGAGAVSGPGSGSGGGFASMLTDATTSLNDSQNTASSDSVASATGQASDVTSVVTDVEKANLEMQLAVQVRNKAVDAYEEIMRMQI